MGHATKPCRTPAYRVLVFHPTSFVHRHSTFVLPLRLPFWQSLLSLTSTICRDAFRPCENRRVEHFAGRRRKSSVYNSLRHIATRELLGPPNAGVGTHLAAVRAGRPPFLYVNRRIHQLATIVPIAPNPMLKETPPSSSRPVNQAGWLKTARTPPSRILSSTAAGGGR